MLVGLEYARNTLLVVLRPDVADGLETNTRNLAFCDGVYQRLALLPASENGNIQVIGPAA
jgi:hypothetical protein